jgi:hypothetical protein
MYALTVGMEPAQAWTQPFDEGFHPSDRLPHFVDVLMGDVLMPGLRPAAA